MKEKPNNWIEYWDTQTIFDESEWMPEMRFFIKATESLLNYGHQDKLLDIGCGTGNLAAFLKDRVKEIYGVDTSERYIESCRKRFAMDKNCHFSTLDIKDYTNLSHLESKKFTIVICLSVIQYYQSIHDIEKLISEVQGVVEPGAKFLIADIFTKTSTSADIRALLKAGFKERRLLKTLAFLLRARFSEYSKLRSSLGLLALSVEEMLNLIDKFNLNAKVLTTRLTRMESRIHLLIEF
ncbi:hypothetical protein AMJ86_05710 [bacterium SM23_57]|nr:MAG: hypothetical protein AMJ86_05710 [bacterium SM23_57]